MPDYRRPKHEVAASDPNRDTTCPFCEAPAKTEIVDHTFQHGAVEISVTLPVRQCADCDEEFVDYVGERIETEAVYYAFGLLSPWDIRDIRERRGLSRPAFAEITGLGEATIKRWETGATAQNRGYDRYLRLLDTDLGWNILKKLARDQTSADRPAPVSGAERFPHVPQDQINSAKASTFRVAA